MPADQDREAQDRHVRALFFSSLGLLSHESTRALVQGTTAHDHTSNTDTEQQETAAYMPSSCFVFALIIMAARALLCAGSRRS